MFYDYNSYLYILSISLSYYLGYDKLIEYPLGVIRYTWLGNWLLVREGKLVSIMCRYKNIFIRLLSSMIYLNSKYKAVARKIFFFVGVVLMYKYVILCNKIWNSNYSILFLKKWGGWTLTPLATALALNSHH